LYANAIYPYIEKFLQYLEVRKTKRISSLHETPHDVILFGFDRVGNDFIKSFEKLQKNYLVVDFNPQLIKAMQTANIPFKYGDAEDAEFLHELNLKETKMFVSTIPDVKTSLLLLKKIKRENPSAIVILLTHDIKTAQELYENGATYVIMPHYLGARYASNLIHRLGFDRKEFEEEKAKHLAYIAKRDA
jgi:Trk K+ transport system NAD-binding subunit